MGKSALVTEFVRRSGVPSVYFAAAKGAPLTDELAQLTLAIAESDLPRASVARGNSPAALALLAAALPGGAGELQRIWDREVAGKPVLLILLGSDLAMMEQLTEHDQPYYARGTEFVLHPLNPRDVSSMTGLNAFEAFDAYLISGGLPFIVRDWERGMLPGTSLKTHSAVRPVRSSSRGSEYSAPNSARTCVPARPSQRSADAASGRSPTFNGPSPA